MGPVSVGIKKTKHPRRKPTPRIQFKTLCV